MKYLQTSKAVTLSIVVSAFLIGCGSSNSSDDDKSNNPDINISPYAGERTLTGNVEQFAGSANLTRSLQNNVISEVVKLYVLDKNGEMKDTHITCPLNSTSYTCDNVAGDKEYIVRYMKNLGDGKVLEMKSAVSVPLDTDPKPAEVSRVSTLIVEAISNTVEEAIVGVEMNEDKITEIIENVKSAIKKSIASLVEKGLISIPTKNDMVIELASNESFDTFTEKDEVKENKSLASASAVITTDKSVTNTLKLSKNDVMADEYANMDNKELIKSIFEATMDDGVPQWVIDFLSDKYDDVPDNYTMSTFLSKLEFKADRDIELEKINIASSSQEYLLSEIEITLNTQLNDGTALAKVKQAILDHYALKEKENKTDADFKALGDFPPIVEVLFSKSFTKDITANTKLENIGQAIAIVSFLENILAQEAIETVFDNANAVFFSEQLENMHIVQIDPMFIFEDLGFQNEITKYDSLSVGHFELKTDRYWGKDEEKEFLSVYASVEKPSWMMGGASADKTKFTKATLTYPTASGAKTVDLDVAVENDWVIASYSPWNHNNPDESKMNITDHISGDYTIDITYNGETATKTFKNMLILKGAHDFRPILVSPSEMPQWPEELNGHNVDWANLTPEQQALQDKFNTDLENYKVPTFSIPQGATSVEDIVFNWSDDSLKTKLEALNLPENIIPAYQVSINKSNQNCNSGSWEECNQEIFNTWWGNRLIKGTSLKLPIPLEATQAGEKYSISVGLVFIDNDTGDDIAYGGHTWAEFTVGDAAILSGDETITFSGALRLKDEKNKLPTNLKVALISEKCEFNNEAFIYSCTLNTLQAVDLNNGTTYTLPVLASTIKEAMDTQSHINIVAFEDKDNNNIFTSWKHDGGIEENENAEIAWWPENSYFWFENWGGLEINTDSYNPTTDKYEFTSTTIAKDTNISVYNIDFNIYTW